MNCRPNPRYLKSIALLLALIMLSVLVPSTAAFTEKNTWFPEVTTVMPNLTWLLELIESTYQAPLEDKLEPFFLQLL